MALSCVYLAADVYLVCLQHALSTEKEEVMGLLIGELDYKKAAHISAVVILRRSDKQKDRVEISPEQLTNATVQADNLTRELGKPMRVVGWYHSHPHITVWPSHVDVETQATYQMMDEGFVGIIISVFNEDSASKEQHVQITCFQSKCKTTGRQANQYLRLEVPLHIQPVDYLSKPCLQAMIELPKILAQEEKDTYYSTTRLPFLSLLAKLKNEVVLTQALCGITEDVYGPLITALEQRKKNNERRCEELRERKKKLLELKSLKH